MTEFQLKQTGEEVQEILDLVGKKVNKEAGKGLSSNDFTNEEKQKLSELQNYDDSEVKERLKLKANTLEILAAILKDIKTHDSAKDAHTDIRNLIISYLQDAKNYTDETIKSLVNNAPEILDTLGELASAIQNNKSVIDAINKGIIAKLDKEEAKDLYVALEGYVSFLQIEKDKLANIEAGANKYVLPEDVVKDSAYIHTDNNYSTVEKKKLAGLKNYDDEDIKTSMLTCEKFTVSKL